jgi:peroxiredoxin Q/BCP
VIATGDPAPAFTLTDDAGNTVSLSDFEGHPVVLYFYPRDNTSGCTAEACDFRDNMARVHATGAMVLGVSPDSEASHQRFKSKYDLPFPLLVDDDHAVAEAYGAWGEKKMSGRTYFGIIRSTFLIDGEGIVSRAWRKVRVKGHVDEVLEALEAL